MLAESGLVIGQRYRVVFQDSRVAGTFTAVLISARVGDDPRRGTFVFDNGVTLSGWSLNNDVRPGSGINFVPTTEEAQ